MTPRQQVAEWLSDLAAGITAGVLRDLGLWLAVALIVAAAVRVVRRWVSREVEDVNRRHKIRKTVGYAGAALVALVGLGFLVGRSVHVAAVLGILGAGAAIALQDVAKSAVGWIYLSSRAGVSPGARVEIGEVVGEVIDVGVLKTTLLEVGNLVEGRQSSGRLATVPNSSFLNQTALLSPDFSPFAWHEVSFLLTFESDWGRGVELLEELGRSRHEEQVAGEVESAFRTLERRFAFKHGTLTPIVYVSARDSGVLLTLRYLTHIRRRRGSEDRITRAVLEAVEADVSLEFAYPTWRVYRREEPTPPPGARGEG